MATKTINTNMSRAYKSSYVTSASVSKMEERDWFFYHLTIDPGTDPSAEDYGSLSTIMSKKFDTYDDAVIAMNLQMSSLLSANLRGAGYQVTG